MMRYISIRNLAPLCGVILGLLVLCNTASPNILQASDDAGGWWLVAVGSTCGGTTWLYCNQGQSPSVIGCAAGDPPFQGVLPGSTGTVVSNGFYAGCHTSPDPRSWYCTSVLSTHCQ